MKEHENSAKGRETYVYTVNSTRFETQDKNMKVAQIKALVPGIEAGDKLSIEGAGDEPDRILDDNEQIHFGKAEGTLHFTVVPSASFGA